MANTDAKTERIQSRVDPPDFGKNTLWDALSRTPGVGLSVIDVHERLLFVNAVSREWFLGSADADVDGKSMRDFHPDTFVDERMDMIQQVVTTSKPMSIDHIYHGRRIKSTLWPMADRKPPFDRVIVVSLTHAGWSSHPVVNAIPFETYETRFIDLGPLNVLTKREVEVMALLGHGLSVPQTAKILHRSVKTIERHKSAISKKLNLSGQSELVMTVSSMGLEVSDAMLTRHEMDAEED
ncbi:Oxygen regulatory protein NreC [Rubripirellula tenax]|uniref:Oxygen regulatory protein NreC n=1 Tax=Rubripirellula tenax TaxID=2528015 RepID=A0A5C6FAX3_9BACT|nr:PAS and helix-turn-helix domain-containing protein [Rubripirellula tenax]TWU58558.1 Oxygen regulatory protein NreC [Rubripirellula tenax]